MLCFCDVTLRDFVIHLNVYSLQYNRIELSKPRMGPMQAIHRRRCVTSRPYATWRYSPCAVLKRRWCLLLAACSMHAHCTIPFHSFPFLSYCCCSTMAESGYWHHSLATTPYLVGKMRLLLPLPLLNYQLARSRLRKVEGNAMQWIEYNCNQLSCDLRPTS